MIQVDYRLILDLFRQDGSLVGQAPVSPDWEPATECAHFSGVRQGRLPAVMNATPAAIKPVWDPKLGEPYVKSFRIVMPALDGGQFCEEVSTVYLRDAARAATATCVAQGKLREGEPFQYRVCAFANMNGIEARTSADFSIEEIEQPLQLEGSSLHSYVNGSEILGKDSVNEKDMPVFISRQVLDEAAAATREAGDLETGGVLVGKLRRDPSVPEIFLEVTAQIRAWDAQAQHAKLTFTAETWAAVRAALDLRKENEMMLGWWHSHPDFCHDCPAERRATCGLARPFFSNEDCALQRTVFGRAFNIGLLLSYASPGELTHTLFGWRHGIIAPRGFYARPVASNRNHPLEVANHGTTKH